MKRGGVVRAAEPAPDITVTPITRDGPAVVSFDMSDAITYNVRGAIECGLSATFSCDAEVRRVIGVSGRLMRHFERVPMLAKATFTFIQ